MFLRSVFGRFNVEFKLVCGRIYTREVIVQQSLQYKLTGHRDIENITSESEQDVIA
jgi:hypothetical protein